jgi:Skp family chaperone for outer membrane proteins
MIAMLGSVEALAQARLATIDLRKVFDGYWKTKQADGALKDRAADMEKEYNNMRDDLKKGREDYQALLNSANDQAVSSEEREKRKKNAEEKLRFLKQSEDSLIQYERQARATLDEQRKRMRDNILGEIRTVLNAKAKTANVSMVIDVSSESANNTPNVLYSNNENDMTQDILSQLNAGAPVDAGKADEKKDEKKKDEKKK